MSPPFLIHNNMIQLRDYQIDIAKRACKLLQDYKIAYLSMQVRTGKTLTSLHTAYLFGANSVLFVTKKKAIDGIMQDFQNTGYVKNIVFSCTNYEMLHKIPDFDWDLIIVDEAHSLGQYPQSSERTKRLKEICYNKPIILLSGTPSPESYSQLFHQFWISSFSPFGHSNFYQWVRHGYVQVGVKYLYNRTMPEYKNANKEMIDEKVKHLFITYTQEEAGFEQLVEEDIHMVDMNAMTHIVADKLKKERVIIGKTGVEIVADTEVKLMQKLHQIYSGSVIDDKTHKAIILDDSKMKYINKAFAGKKIAIFYKFVGEREIITSFYKNIGKQLTESPEEFNANDDMIFISQIQSGREGINLSSADCLVMYNIDFSAVSYWQVRARLQSKDRTKTAKVCWIFARQGIEPKIYEAVNNKKDYTLSYFKKDFKC